jgi:hypothetical protein
MSLVDVVGNRPMPFAAVGASGAATGPARCGRGNPTRERGGLSVHLAAGVVEEVLEVVDLLPQGVALLPVPVSVPIRLLVLAPESIDLALLSLQLRDQVIPRRGPPSGVHALVMPRSPMEYKKKTLNGARRRPPSRSVTR